MPSIALSHPTTTPARPAAPASAAAARPTLTGQAADTRRLILISAVALVIIMIVFLGMMALLGSYGPTGTEPQTVVTLTQH